MSSYKEYYPEVESIKNDWKNYILKKHEVTLSDSTCIDVDAETMSIDFLMDGRRYTLTLDKKDWLDLLSELLTSAKSI